MSNSNRIRVDDLEKEIKSIFNTFSHNVNTAIDEAGEAVGNKGKKNLKATSPYNPKGHHKGGHYKNRWKLSKEDGKYYLSNDNYRLPHLLENGHDIKNQKGGKSYGHVKGIAHIKPVEEFVQEEFPKEFERRLNSK